MADKLLTIHEECDDAKQASTLSSNIKWLLSRRSPKRYGDKIQVDIAQTVDIRGAMSDAKERAAPAVQAASVRISSTVVPALVTSLAISRVKENITSSNIDDDEHALGNECGDNSAIDIFS